VTQKDDDVDVVVIGGGFAGVIATRELVHAGHSVTLIEARDRLGGRTHFKDGALQGLSLEMGGQFLSPSEPMVSAEVKRYGVPITEPEAYGLPSVWVLEKETRHGALPIDDRDYIELETLIAVLVDESSRIDPDLSLTSQGLLHLDTPFDDFLRSKGVGSSLREYASLLFSPFFARESIHEVSAVHALRMIRSAGGLWRFIGGDVQWLENGTRSLLDAITDDAVSSGAHVRLSSPVTRIEHDDHGVRVSGEGFTIRAGAAVVAVPLAPLGLIQFAPALGTARLQASQERRYAEGHKIWAVLRDAPEDFYAVGRGPGIHYIDTFDTVADGTLVYTFGPALNWLDGNDRGRLQSAIRRFLPDAEVVDCAATDWKHEPYTLGSWSHYGPGQVRRFEEMLPTAQGRLAFAGSDTSWRWPGYVEGAVATGYQAAERVHKWLRGIR
jgi:monoamine oxidase